MVTTVASTFVGLVTTIVLVSLAYGKLDAADRMHDRRLDQIEAQAVTMRAEEKSENTEAGKRQHDIERRLSTMEGDIRVIRQIVEGVRPAPR